MQEREYIKKNKDKRKEIYKKYRSKNESKVRNYAREYYKNNKDRIDAYRKANKDKHNARCKIWRDKNKEKMKNVYKKSNLLRKNGLTVEQYNNLKILQNNLCAICGINEPGGMGRWHVDHCHVKNKIRGLLCSRCNTMLGLSRESITILNNAIDYLNKHNNLE